MPVIAATAALLLTAASVEAAGGDVGTYRANVNAICRANTPAFSRYATTLVAAQKARDEVLIGTNLGLPLNLMFVQDRRIYAVKAPVAARAPMAPIIARLRAGDSLLLGVIAGIKQQDTATITQDWGKFVTVITPLRKLYDGYGLSACGSQPILG